MATTILEDAYEVSGISESEFYKHLLEFDECTEHRKENEGVFVLSYAGEENGNLIYKDDNLGFTVSPAIVDIKNSVSESFVTELKESKAPVIYFADGTWAFSNNRAVGEIAAAFGLNGSKLTEPDEYLHRYLSHISSEKPLTYVIRKHNGYNKVMSIRTGKYQKIPMVESFESIDTFCEKEDVGMMSVKGFNCNQYCSSIFIQFPYLTDSVQQRYNLKTQLIPGILVSNNDLGYSTLSYAQLFYRDNSSSTRPYETGEPCVAKHTSGFKADEFVNRVSKEIWEKLSEVPKALSEAMAHPITDTDGFIEKIFLHIQLYKVFQKKTTESCRYIENFRTMLNQELSSVINPTAYDAIVAVMDAPDSLKGKIPDSYYSQLEHACSSAWSVALP